MSNFEITRSDFEDKGEELIGDPVVFEPVLFERDLPMSDEEWLVCFCFDGERYYTNTGEEVDLYGWRRVE